MTTTYRVLLNGASSGQEINRVATQLANLFKIPPEKALALLTKPGIAVKREVDLPTASRYQAALGKAGCNCLVQPEITQQETPAIDPTALQSAASQGAAPIGRSSPSPASDVSDTAPREIVNPVSTAQKLEKVTTVVDSLVHKAGSLWSKASLWQRALVILVPLILGYAMWGLIFSSKDNPALIAAVTRGDVAAVKRLLADGANPNSRGGDQNRPALVHAALQGHTEIVEALLKAGANAKASHNGLSVLTWATMGGTPVDSAIATVGKLTAKGANLNEQDSQGDTALHRSVRNPRSNGSLAIALVAMGADTSIKDKNGKTPVTLAIEHNASQDLVNALNDRELAKRIASTKSETGTQSSSPSAASNEEGTTSAPLPTASSADVLGASTSIGRVSLSTKESPGTAMGNKSRQWVVKLGDKVVHSFDSEGTPDFFNAESAGKQPVVVESGNEVAVAVYTNNGVTGKGCETAFLAVFQSSGTSRILDIPNECKTLQSARLQDGKILFFLYGDKEPSIVYQDGTLKDVAFEKAMATCRSLASHPGPVLQSYDYQKRRDVGLACETAAKKAPKDAEALYLDGKYKEYISEDYSEAEKMYRASADMGHAEALASLDRYSMTGCRELASPAWSVLKSYDKHKKKMTWIACQSAAKHSPNDPELHYLLGSTYLLHDNYSESMKWYRLAAEKGNADAMSYIGLLHYNGAGVKQDYNEAMNWYRLGAEKGSVRAMGNIALLYATGKGVAKDNNEAMKWYRLAAEKGDASSMRNIGDLYDTGAGVAKDYDEAMKWFRRGAEKGSARAMADIGGLYEDGKGVAKDYNEAMKWFRLGAEKGDAVSMASIGVLYAKGQGVAKDLQEARKWFLRAEEVQPGIARENLEILTSNEDTRNRINRAQCAKLYEQEALGSANPAAKEAASQHLRSFGCL